MKTTAVYNPSAFCARYFMPVLLLSVFIFPASAQHIFKATLLNQRDSTPVAYAALLLTETNTQYITDDKGHFQFSIPAGTKDITLQISAIGFKGIVHYHPQYNGMERVYIDVVPNSLEDFSFNGLSPMQVVKKAVAAIPNNYANKSYFAFSSYRQYDRVNNIFRNLMEGNIVVLMRLLKTKDGITADEGYTSTQFRRIQRFRDNSSFFEDNPADLLPENVIYHLAQSAIAPNKLSEYQFSFGTPDEANDYVINYTCYAFSSERHGFTQMPRWIYSGESFEKGTLVIARDNFAIKRIERQSFRNPSYPYRKGKLETNILSSGKYYFEFADAKLVAEYAPIDGKYYLQAMNYEYANNFFKTFMGNDDYAITTCFEWRLDSVSRYVTGDMLKAFHKRLVREEYHYNPNEWDNFDLPFYFYPKDTILNDLRRHGALDDQFTRQCKEDEKEYLYYK